MKTSLSLLLFHLLSFNIYSQVCVHREETIRYSDALEVFSVCLTNPTINFDQRIEYFWYTEFSGIKSTKGGCGGKLLDGSYRLYDLDGNLRTERNYSSGVEDNETNWDENGNIVSISRSKNGEINYFKYKDSTNVWLEFIGSFMKIGSIKNQYNSFNYLVFSETMISDFQFHTKHYYDYSPQLQAEYSYNWVTDSLCCGKYIEYYKNGKVKVEGQFYEGKDEEWIYIRVGTWKWFYEDGSIDAEYEYKADIQYWPNGEKNHRRLYLGSYDGSMG